MLPGYISKAVPNPISNRHLGTRTPHPPTQVSFYGLFFTAK